MIPIEIEVDDYLDRKNEKLFKDLSKEFQIILQKIPGSAEQIERNIWQMNLQDKTATISFYNDYKSSCFFTHELLHLDLISKGFTDSAELFALFERGSVEQMMLSGTIGQVQNILGHHKFYDDFIGFEYREDEFTGDFYSKPNPEFVVEAIENELYKRDIPNQGVILFINSFFTIKDCRNQEFLEIYDELDRYLREKDQCLYNSIEDAWELWLNDTELDNETVIKQLYTETANWYRSKK